jgi:Family of unknown function (DUF6187)
LSDYDTRFTLPAVDDPASVEVGVILMGLDVERLLAGLGVAALGDDATLAMLVVDQARHGIPPDLTMSALVSGGARRWRAARSGLAAADPGGPPSAAVRRAWARAVETVATADLPDWGPASRAYLTACWLHRVEVDAYVEDLDAVPQVAP